MLAKPVTTSHRGAFYILGAVIWEFFSYYGMKALLILYLVHQLHFTDYHAYQVFGAYTTLVYLTPILGGWLADKYWGYRKTVLMGSSAIITGHLLLCFGDQQCFYYGLACLVIGVGLFKSNAICLVGAFFQNSHKKSSAYAVYYVVGNIGATAAPIICALVATSYGWKYGFLCAGIGMLIGTLIFLSGWDKVKSVEDASAVHISSRITKKVSFPISLAGIFGSVIIVSALIKYNIIDIPLILIGLVALWIVLGAFIQSKTKKDMTILLCLILFATLFWAFDQQGGSSISIFIDKFINRNFHLGLLQHHIQFSIPTASFQSINPAIIILLGPVVGIIWKRLGKHGIEPSEIIKVLIGMLMVTLGFYFIGYAALSAEEVGHASSLWIFLGLSITGLAEMFFDPVVLSFISNKAPREYQSRLSGLYYLAVGTYANYIAMKIAETTAPLGVKMSSNSAAYFSHTYTSLCYIGLFLTGAVLLVWLFANYNRVKLFTPAKWKPGFLEKATHKV